MQVPKLEIARATRVAMNVALWNALVARTGVIPDYVRQAYPVYETVDKDPVLVAIANAYQIALRELLSAEHEYRTHQRAVLQGA